MRRGVLIGLILLLVVPFVYAYSESSLDSIISQAINNPEKVDESSFSNLTDSSSIIPNAPSSVGESGSLRISGLDVSVSSQEISDNSGEIVPVFEGVIVNARIPSNQRATPSEDADEKIKRVGSNEINKDFKSKVEADSKKAKSSDSKKVSMSPNPFSRFFTGNVILADEQTRRLLNENELPDYPDSPGEPEEVLDDSFFSYTGFTSFITGNTIVGVPNWAYDGSKGGSFLWDAKHTAPALNKQHFDLELKANTSVSGAVNGIVYSKGYYLDEKNSKWVNFSFEGPGVGSSDWLRSVMAGETAKASLTLDKMSNKDYKVFLAYSCLKTKDNVWNCNDNKWLVFVVETGDVNYHLPVDQVPPMEYKEVKDLNLTDLPSLARQFNFSVAELNPKFDDIQLISSVSEYSSEVGQVEKLDFVVRNIGHRRVSGLEFEVDVGEKAVAEIVGANLPDNLDVNESYRGSVSVLVKGVGILSFPLFVKSRHNEIDTSDNSIYFKVNVSGAFSVNVSRDSLTIPWNRTMNYSAIESVSYTKYGGSNITVISGTDKIRTVFGGYWAGLSINPTMAVSVTPKLTEEAIYSYSTPFVSSIKISSEMLTGDREVVSYYVVLTNNENGKKYSTPLMESMFSYYYNPKTLIPDFEFCKTYTSKVVLVGSTNETIDIISPKPFNLCEPTQVLPEFKVERLLKLDGDYLVVKGGFNSKYFEDANIKYKVEFTDPKIAGKKYITPEISSREGFGMFKISDVFVNRSIDHRTGEVFPARIVPIKQPAPRQTNSASDADSNEILTGMVSNSPSSAGEEKATLSWSWLADGRVEVNFTDTAGTILPVIFGDGSERYSCAGVVASYSSGEVLEFNFGGATFVPNKNKAGVIVGMNQTECREVKMVEIKVRSSGEKLVYTDDSGTVSINLVSGGVSKSSANFAGQFAVVADVSPVNTNLPVILPGNDGADEKIHFVWKGWNIEQSLISKFEVKDELIWSTPRLSLSGHGYASYASKSQLWSGDITYDPGFYFPNYMSAEYRSGLKIQSVFALKIKDVVADKIVYDSRLDCRVFDKGDISRPWNANKKANYSDSCVSPYYIYTSDFQKVSQFPEFIEGRYYDFYFNVEGRNADKFEQPKPMRILYVDPYQFIANNPLFRTRFMFMENHPMSLFVSGEIVDGEKKYIPQIGVSSSSKNLYINDNWEIKSLDTSQREIELKNLYVYSQPWKSVLYRNQENKSKAPFSSLSIQVTPLGKESSNFIARDKFNCKIGRYDLVCYRNDFGYTLVYVDSENSFLYTIYLGDDDYVFLKKYRDNPQVYDAVVYDILSEIDRNPVESLTNFVYIEKDIKTPVGSFGLFSYSDAHSLLPRFIPQYPSYTRTFSENFTAGYYLGGFSGMHPDYLFKDSYRALVYDSAGKLVRSRDFSNFGVFGTEVYNDSLFNGLPENKFYTINSKNLNRSDFIWITYEPFFYATDAYDYFDKHIAEQLVKVESLNATIMPFNLYGNRYSILSNGSKYCQYYNNAGDSLCSDFEDYGYYLSNSSSPYLCPFFKSFTPGLYLLNSMNPYFLSPGDHSIRAFSIYRTIFSVQASRMGGFFNKSYVTREEFNKMNFAKQIKLADSDKFYVFDTQKYDDVYKFYKEFPRSSNTLDNGYANVVCTSKRYDAEGYCPQNVSTIAMTCKWGNADKLTIYQLVITQSFLDKSVEELYNLDKKVLDDYASYVRAIVERYIKLFPPQSLADLDKK